MLKYLAVISSFIPWISGVFIFELTTTDRVPYCTAGFNAHGWLLLYYNSQVYLEPRDSSVNLAVDNSGTRLILKFCETLEDLQLPRGDYCIIKGRSSCPQNFEDLPFPLTQTQRSQESLHFGELSLCCSSRMADPISFPFSPPFSLIKKGSTCERIANTSKSEVSVKMVKTAETLLDICYYDIDPCNQDNGGCEQVCYTDDSKIKCSCYPGFTLINRTHCYRRNIYALTYESYTEQKQPGLFTLKRDYVIVTITLAVFLLVLTAISVLLIRLNKIVCVSECFSPHRNFMAGGMRNVVRRYSAEKGNTLRSRASTHTFNRDSISAPVGVVAVDLLNRPKSHANNLQDVRSCTNTNRNSYYVDSPNTMNTEVEGMYDSLDRSQNRRVVMTTPAQYEEPDKDAARPLILPQSDDQYYLEPDENIPETPLPAYSPNSSAPADDTAVLDTTEPQVYTFNTMYQEPCAKFSVGTLGRKEGAHVAAVARIAPVPRTRNLDSLKRNSSHVR